MRICPNCKINERDTKHAYCRQCRALKQKKYNKKYRESDHGKKKMHELTKNWIRSKHGFTNNLFNEMLENQKYLCAICGTNTPSKNNKKDWHADHDHTTGKARGVLCAGCNTLLGRIESVGFDWIDKAKVYLKNESSSTG